MSVQGLLESIISRLAISKPACLLLPDDWDRCKEVLHTFDTHRAYAKISRVITDLDRRNRNVMHSPTGGPSTSQQSLHLLYHLLDNLDYHSTVNIDSVAFECMSLVPDHINLVSAILRWSSSMYRQGSHRIYLVTRLLRKWNQVGIDVFEGIIGYIPELVSDYSKDPDPVFRIVAELVRSKTFLLGRYLQWLIATGSTDSVHSVHTVRVQYQRL